MRDWFLTLDQEEYVELALTEGGLKGVASRPRDACALGLYRPFPESAVPVTQEPARSRSRTGRERALVIGISDYPPPIRKLPAVANDVREIAKLLGSDEGQFPTQNVRSLADGEATQKAVLEADRVYVLRCSIPTTPCSPTWPGTAAVVGGEYYFLAHDSTVKDIATSGVPLTKRSRHPSTRRRASGPSCGWTSVIAGASSPVTSGPGRTTGKLSAGLWR